ncbi:nitrile hydratase accessory protein [Granulosicoccus antarcticus]|uniref:Nitrile hydratase beta subunit-like N-terminal domain-containing protein n=1 Tax=Granulosicoccus antarcticus IMCC3135 TaxID=1192854 RepID=A0A2Z2NV85_9GAMM|nr:nitrile hydratase accessory protein [Granulosicoccus antarcticus]ASJ71034.1 hypothetical protein IMCC3135_04605 [Granulosicoccus antarcticus IMCC3135]
MNHNTPNDKNSDTALQALPSIPRDTEGPVFSEPWEAEVFAMTLSLHEQGVFTWQEWATTLSESIRTAQQQGDPDLGDTYYSHWLSALEHMIVQKRIGERSELARLHNDWDEAACRTPHGQPIELSR